MEDYWRLMPGYQGVRLEDVQPLRILFGYFPTYRASPLQPAWDRVLQARAGPTALAPARPAPAGSGSERWLWPRQAADAGFDLACTLIHAARACSRARTCVELAQRRMGGRAGPSGPPPHVAAGLQLFTHICLVPAPGMRSQIRKG